MQWAEFIDKNGDINEPNNYIQGSLQGSRPNPHQIGEFWEQNHPNWLEVPDSFVPPAPVPTKEQLIASLDTEYQPQFAELSRALGLASLADNQLGIQGIKEDYNALLSEYNTKRGAING